LKKLRPRDFQLIVQGHRTKKLVELGPGPGPLLFLWCFLSGKSLCGLLGCIFDFQELKLFLFSKELIKNVKCCEPFLRYNRLKRKSKSNHPKRG
jgi:hypothetical protein